MFIMGARPLAEQQIDSQENEQVQVVIGHVCCG